MTSPSGQTLFKKTLSLVGHTVEAGTIGSTKPLHGKITNAMFDSFILEEGGRKHIIRFEDILFLTPKA